MFYGCNLFKVTVVDRFYTPKGCKKYSRWLASAASVTTGKCRNPSSHPIGVRGILGLYDPGVAPHSRLTPGYFPCTAPRCTPKTPGPAISCAKPRGAAKESAAATR